MTHPNPVPCAVIVSEVIVSIELICKRYQTIDAYGLCGAFNNIVHIVNIYLLNDLGLQWWSYPTEPCKEIYT